MYSILWLQFSLWPVGAAASHVNTRTVCGGRSLYGVNYQLGERSGVHSRTVRGTDTSNSSQSTERKKTPATDARGRNALYTAMRWNDSQDLTSKTWVPLGNSITRWGWRWCWGWQLCITVAWRLLSCVMLWSPARNVLRNQVGSCPIARRRFCGVEANFRTGFRINKRRMDGLDHIGWYVCVGYSKCVYAWMFKGLFRWSTCVQNCCLQHTCMLKCFKKLKLYVWCAA